MSWLQPFAPVDGRPVLVCLPQAGAGCGMFRTWQDVFGHEVAVVGVQLPGRENRFAAPPPETFAHVVAEVVAALADLRPTVLFGHSLGALIGYEVARALPAPPAALVVAASRPPHRSGPAGGLAHDTDEGFARALMARGLDEELRELAMSALRQDAGLAATYVDPAGARVPCDLHVWGGDADERVSPADLAAWRDYAGAACHTRWFRGGHDFVVETADVPVAVRALVSRAGGVTWRST